MGVELSGIVINKYCQDDFESIEKQFGWTIQRQFPLNFSAASGNGKDVELCDVYFGDRGTLIFLSEEKCKQSYAIPNCNSLTFSISESQRTFYLNYCENGIDKRTLMEVDGSKYMDIGEKLNIEVNGISIVDLIWKQIDVLVREPYREIKHDATAIRYWFCTDKVGPTRFMKDDPLSKIDQTYLEALKIPSDKSGMMSMIIGNHLEEYLIRGINTPDKRMNGLFKTDYTSIEKKVLIEARPFIYHATNELDKLFIDLFKNPDGASISNRKKLGKYLEEYKLRGFEPPSKKRPLNTPESEAYRPFKNLSIVDLDLKLYHFGDEHPEPNDRALLKMKNIMEEYKTRGIDTPDKR